MTRLVRTHSDLEVYAKAFAAARHIFVLSASFPPGEIFGLTNQIRRSSRSVCANIAEGWRKRRYKKSFISKLSDAETEAAETQVWLEFAVDCHYIQRDEAVKLYQEYSAIIKTLTSMIHYADKWVSPVSNKEE